MKFVKRIGILLMALALLMLGGCAQTQGSPEAAPDVTVEATPMVGIAVDATPMWVITVTQCELTESIASTKAFVEYGGDTTDVSYLDAPTDGNYFLLVNLKINKEQLGQSKFEWAHLYVTDAAGEKYARHENDTFLQLHGLPRIKSTALSIGNNEGYICFEVPKTIDMKTLMLVCDLEGSVQVTALQPE